MTKKDKALQVVNIIATVGLVFLALFAYSKLGVFFLKLFDNSVIAQLLTFAVIFLLFFISFFIHIILHEGGHLVCGLLSGYKFSSFRILSFCFVKDNDKIKVKKLKVAGTGGQCLMLPPKTDDIYKTPYKLYNFGGAISNAIFSTIFLTLALLLKDNAVLFAVFEILAIVGFTLAINNALPLKAGLIQNDGKNVSELNKHKQSIESFVLQLNVSALQIKGVTVRDMPEEWFNFPEIDQLKSSLMATKGYLVCVREIDKGDFYNAHLLIRKLLQNAPDLLPIYRILLELELIYFDALHGWATNENILTRFNKYQKAIKAIQATPSVQRVLFAVCLLCKNDEEGANKHLALFEKYAKKYPYKQEIEFERKLVELAKQRSIQLKTQPKND